VHSIGGPGPVVDPALAWSSGLSVKVGGAGTVAHAGVVLPRLLGDRLGLTVGLSQVMARAGFVPLRHRGRALVDAACALAAGATCLSDIEAMTRQVEIFGPEGGASDTTMLRVLDELSGRLNDAGLPGRRLARAVAAARAKAWSQIVARHGALPAVRVAGADLTRPGEGGLGARPVVVVRVDATLIGAASNKEGAAGTYKGGFGFHPMTAWCTNVGDNLAVMLRPGNAGSFTASDHLLVLDAALAQIPPGWRTDVLVTIDGAGASHEVIEHLTALNTSVRHGKRGRRVEYSPRGGTPRSAGRWTRAPGARWSRCARGTGRRRWTRTGTPTPRRTWWT
jgi:Transposase DDE domain group 1